MTVGSRELSLILKSPCSSFILLIIILSSSLSLFSESKWTGNDTSGSATMNISFTDVTGFTDSSSTEHGFVVFGFTNSSAKETVITPTDTLVLSETFKGSGEATASGSIYAFVRVASRSKLKFTLTWNPIVVSTSLSLGLTVNGNNSEYTFYTFDPSVNVMADERIALLVSTTYTNKDVTGSFSTTITMKVETTT